MKFAISYNTAHHGTDPDQIIAYAQHAEEVGFEGIYFPEHIALYPGASLGTMEFPTDVPIADPLDCLSFVAAATSKLLLGTAVLLLPYHHPVALAKRLATIDVLSRGRMRLLTVGVGSLPGEAQAASVDYKTRGARTDEAIEVLRLLWSGDKNGVSYHGDFYSFDNLCSYPKPLGDLPIHIGGSSNPAARRAGRYGNGYFPGGMLTPAERAAQMDLARSAAQQAGRDPDALEYTRWGSIDMPQQRVDSLAAQGVTRIVVSTSATETTQQQAEMSAFARRFHLQG
jgi:probable F420-dependent oxidoreductase